MRTLALIVLCASFGNADSSLTFGANTTDVVTVTAASSINSLSKSTKIYWLYPTAIATGQKVYSRTNPTRPFMDTQAAGAFRYRELQTTTDTEWTTATPALANNQWFYIATTYDDTATPRTHTYIGFSTAAATEATYGTSSDGSGTKGSDATVNLSIGGNGSAPFVGQIAFYGQWNRVLSLAEIQDIQFTPKVTSGCVDFLNFGFNGTGTQYDLSGNGNPGAVTGATGSSNGPAISFPQGAI